VAKLKLFFATDIHGSDRLFLKLMHVPEVYKTPLLVVGGDITG
jgi:Icc-related predicted phosphoesterase